MPPSTLRLLRLRCSPAFAVGLALVLMLASALGLAHRTLHLGAGGGHVLTIAGGEGHPLADTAKRAGQAASAAAARVHTLHAGLAALFDDHEDGSALCLLFDQLQHDGATPSVALVVLPALPPAAVMAFMQGEALRRWVLLFDARGPPAAR